MIFRYDPNQVHIFDDYENGYYPVIGYTNKKWWQFWKPKSIIGYAYYTKIGKIINIYGIPSFFLDKTDLGIKDLPIHTLY